MKRILIIYFCACIFLNLLPNAWAKEMASNLAGNTAEIAIPSVFRIIVPAKNRIGTGFLHKSGHIITAAHVVAGCSLSEIIIFDIAGHRLPIIGMTSNMDFDLALLKIDTAPPMKVLEISQQTNFQIGAQVSIWGYPEGYSGRPPLIMSGYLSGLDNDPDKLKEGKVIPRWVINAAFNNGNSGSPLIDIEKGEVIGVVSSKLAPIPPTIANALNVLKSQQRGFIYSARNDKGQSINLSEAQIIEMVLQYLRSQTQLVIGEAVTVDNLRMFLKSNKVDP